MTSSTINARADFRGRTKSPYLVNPVFDLMFVCGGLALVPILLCAYIFAADMAHIQFIGPVIILSVIGTYFLSSPHSAATLFRLYGESETRRKNRFVAWGLPAILLLSFALALRVPELATLEAMIYLLFIWQHVMAQCYGIAMMYCARAGLRMTAEDKVLPKIIMHTGVALAITEQFTGSWQRSSFMGIFLSPTAFLPEWAPAILQTALAIAIILFFVDQTKKAKLNRAMPLPAVITLMVGAILMSLNRSISEFVWLFVPAFFHASQYLAVMFAYHYKNDDTGGKLDRLYRALDQAGNRFVQYFLAGIFIFTVLPLMVASFGFPYVLCSALVFFSVNLHHFAADARVWKLKDKAVQDALTK